MKERSHRDIHSERVFWIFAIVFFAILALLTYWRVILGDVPLPGILVTQFPAYSEFQTRDPRPPVADIGDLIDYFYPYHALSAEQVRNGIIPLWNPYVMGGFPLQAEPQTALFYPLHALYYVSSTPTAWTLGLLLRTCMAGMFMTLLIRRIGGSKTGSIIAGTAFALSGFVVAWQGSAMGDSVIWLPLVCYAVARLHQRPSILAIAIAAVSFSMPVLAGHPETAAHVVATAFFAALLLWIFPTHGTRFNLSFLLAFSVSGLLAIGLAAVQLLPTLEWILQADRNLNEIWPSFPLHQGMGFLSRDILHGPNSAGILMPNAAAYVGMFTILAACVGLLHSSTRYVIWFAALIAFGLAATFGFEPVHWLLTHVPIVKGLKNERLLLLADFGLAALAGLGVTVLEGELFRQSHIRRRLAWILTGLVFCLGLICIYKLRLASEFRVDWLRRPSFSRAMLIAGMLVLLWRFVRNEKARFFPIVAVALVTFDLVTFAYGFTSFTPRDEIFPNAPVFDFLKQQGPSSSFRIMRTAGDPFGSNFPVAYGIESLTGYEVQVPRALKRFTADFIEDLQPYISVIGEKILSLNDRRIDMLNVKHLVVLATAPEYERFRKEKDRFLEVFKRGNVAVFENRNVLPRAFLVNAAGIEVIADPEEQIRRLKDPAFEPERSVILNSIPAEFVREAPFSAEPGVKGQTEIIENDINGYRFRVQAPSPSILIVSQNPYPGWRASVGGQRLSVFVANHTLTGIAVPEGNHEIEFVLDPPLFKLGAVFSLVSVCILLGLLTYGIRAMPK